MTQRHIVRIIMMSLLFLNISYRGKAQNIEIGMQAEEVKMVVEYTVNNSANRNISWDVYYTDGEISDVVKCYYHQQIVDFKLIASFCTHYLMLGGKLEAIQVQYQDVSVKKLNEIYKRLYPDSDLDGLYYDEEYEHKYRIFLADNGLATVEYRKVESLRDDKSTQPKNPEFDSNQPLKPSTNNSAMSAADSLIYKDLFGKCPVINRFVLTEFSSDRIPESMYGAGNSYSLTKDQSKKGKYVYIDNINFCMICLNDTLIFAKAVGKEVFENESYKVYFSDLKETNSLVTGEMIVVEKKSGSQIVKSIVGGFGD